MKTGESRSTCELSTPIAGSLTRLAQRVADRLVSAATGGARRRSSRRASAFRPSVEVAPARAGSGARRRAAAWRQRARSGGSFAGGRRERRLGDQRLDGERVEAPRPAQVVRALRAQWRASYARSTSRAESHGGANASSATAIRPMPPAARLRAGMLRSTVDRGADADDDERGQPDGRNRPDPVATGMHGEVRACAERAGGEQRVASEPSDGDERQHARREDEQQPPIARSRSTRRARASASAAASRALAVAEVGGVGQPWPPIPDDGMPLELVERDAPEVVAVRAELAEVARRRSPVSRCLNASHASCVHRTGWSTVATKRPTPASSADGEQREHGDPGDPASPGSDTRESPIGEGIDDADDGGDRSQHERDRPAWRTAPPNAAPSARNGSVSAQRRARRARPRWHVGTRSRKRVERDGEDDDRRHRERDAAALALRADPEREHRRRAAERDPAEHGVEPALGGQRDRRPERDERHRRLAVPVRDREVEPAGVVEQVGLAAAAQSHGRGERERRQADRRRRSPPSRSAAERSVTSGVTNATA